MLLIFSKVFLIGSMGILKVSLRIFTDGIKVVVRAPAVMTMRGFTFHTRALMSSIRGWYLSILFAIIYGKNLLLQYVNSMNSAF
jgi:hypothetical protein